MVSDARGACSTADLCRLSRIYGRQHTKYANFRPGWQIIVRGPTGTTQTVPLSTRVPDTGARVGNSCRTSEGDQKSRFIHCRAASFRGRGGGSKNHLHHARGRIFRHETILHNLFGISVENT